MNDSQNSRRDFLKKASLVSMASIGFGLLGDQVAKAEAFLNNNQAPFTLPPLPYTTDALEPHIDKMTMEIHHTKHHQAYVNNLNKVCAESKIDASLEELIANISKYPVGVRNNGGGHWNHSFFWNLMKPASAETNQPTGKTGEAIIQAFGNFDEFKKQFNTAAMSRFGSGWAWLLKTKEGKLSIGSTPNQDNPLMDVSDLKGTPLLALDVWEHAYYLKYQNKRADYVNAWWNVINWDNVAKNLG